MAHHAACTKRDTPAVMAAGYVRASAQGARCCAQCSRGGRHRHVCGLEQLPDRRLLAVGQRRGEGHGVHDKQVAARGLLVVDGHALALDVVVVARLGDAARLQHHLVPVQVLDGAAEARERVHQRDGLIDEQVVAAALPALGGDGAHDELQVAGLAVNHGLALLKERDGLAVDHAGLHVHGNHLLLAHQLVAGALLAHLLVELLEHAGAQLLGHQLLLALALALAGAGLDHRLVTSDLELLAVVQGVTLGHTVLLLLTTMTPTEEEVKDVATTVVPLCLLPHVLLQALLPVTIINPPLLRVR
mmetsp:Transcript_38175/g.96619  ORF Transcript_38175/g.96619 Transcript_38175/m.96619 type:complete len:302 (+) Transcript_38175:219-1124(+)